MSGIGLEVVMILALVVINGLLALAEFAIVSARKTRLQQLAEQGNHRAGSALDLADNPGEFLSTVQVGITLVGVLAGAFGGVGISAVLAGSIRSIPGLAPYSDGIALALVVGTITLLSLVIGELVPKRLALSRPEAFAMALAGPMRFLSRLTRPVVRVLSFLTNSVLRLLRVPAPEDSVPNEEEIKVMLSQATRAGVFEDAEHDMLEGVLRLGDRRVSGLITPRTEITWLDLEDPIEINLRKLLDSRYSHLPAGDGTLDDIQGIVDVRQVLTAIVAGSEPTAELDLTEFLLPPVFVPEYLPALEALDVFRTSKTALLLVIDEFGGFQGIVTIGDLLESVVGELPTADTSVDSEVVLRDDGSMLIDGMYAIDELMELCDLSELPGGDQGLFETLGGFVMHYLGRIPAPGDRFEWNGWRFEVVDMDGLRVDKVLALRAPQGDSGRGS